jgi:hypothetical protein
MRRRGSQARHPASHVQRLLSLPQARLVVARLSASPFQTRGPAATIKRTDIHTRTASFDHVKHLQRNRAGVAKVC